MKRMISLLLAGLMLLTAVPSVGLAEQGTTGHSNPLAVSDSTNGSVIDGVKDSFYTEERSIGSDYWSFYSGNVTTADPVDTERLLNKLYFNWDEDFVYLYFESTYTLEDEHLYKPAEGEERDSQGERYPWYEQISLYLDTAPSLSYEAPCQAPSDWNDPYCSHFHCNANDGEGKHYRLQARTAPAFGDWWNYYRSDEGMFMTYEEFVDYRTTPESRGYDEQYVDDPMGWYLKNNGAGEAASFVNYETDTYGFELKYPRREGEEYFQVNVVNDVNAYEWAEYGPELPYTLSFCEAWWMSAEGMVKIWYEDFQGNDSVADSVASVESMITVLPDSVTLDDEEKVIAAFEAYMALTES
ncbi:MAG: hypothetical protein IKM39_02845, partial [Clostridia bacterium]|nr:hypothetical protein [Clostridia bacterium]